MKNFFRVSLSCLLVTLTPMSKVAAVEQFTPYDEIKKKSAPFEPRASLDTAPVKVKIVDITYQIPRNYLTHLEPAIPTLKLTWPGLKPLTEETRKCFGSILQSNEAGCTSIEFHLLGSRGPAPGGGAYSNKEMFANFKKYNPDIQPRSGPFAYDIYDTGPEEARIEHYRRIDDDLFFHCMISKYNGTRGAVCNDMFSLTDNNGVQFFFRLEQIGEIPEIENGIRRLMSNFVVRGDKQ